MPSWNGVASSRSFSVRSRENEKCRRTLRQAMPFVLVCGRASSFVAQKCRLSVGMIRARAKIGMLNLVYNFTRLAWLKERTASAGGARLRLT
jgi:hypothetical protein